MTGLSRRAVLGASVALSVTSLPAAAAQQRSYAATHGAAPFATEHLIPGAPLDLDRVDRSSPLARVVALTIDDGPDPKDLAILEILRRFEAKATFFCIGRKVPKHRDIAAAVAASGNEIGSHTQDHPLMTDLSPAQRERNFVKAEEALAEAGIRPVWFRPPYGDVDGATAAQARAHGMRTVLWTADSQDWKGLGAEAVAQRVTERLAPGAVVLMHSTKASTVRALPAILEEGARQGYRFVTMTEWWAAMLAASPAQIPVL